MRDPLNPVPNARLRAHNLAQRFVGAFLLTPDYNKPWRPTRVRFEHVERIPKDRPSVFVMNHTDYFQYFPFQWWLWAFYYNRMVATWVKPKYYDRWPLSVFFRHTNNIRVPSRGYLIERDAKLTLERKLTKAEYRALRDWVDGKSDGSSIQAMPELAPLLTQARPNFDPARVDYAAYIRSAFIRQMQEVTDLSLSALNMHDLNLMVFPQGTRAKRLLPAHLGITQIILKTNHWVVPIGCNGGDRLFPGASPFSSGGDVVYRVGTPLRPGVELAEFAVGDFKPYDPADEETHKATFAALAHRLTMEIDALLDDEYKLDPATLDATWTTPASEQLVAAPSP